MRTRIVEPLILSLVLAAAGGSLAQEPKSADPRPQAPPGTTRRQEPPSHPGSTKQPREEERVPAPGRTLGPEDFSRGKLPPSRSGPPMSALTTASGQLRVQGRIGPVVEISPGFPLDLQWNINAPADVTLTLHRRSSDPSSRPLNDRCRPPALATLHGLQGTERLPPPDGFTAGSGRQWLWICITARLVGHLATTNAVPIEVFHAASAARAGGPFQVTDFTAEQSGAQVLVRFNVRNNTGETRDLTTVRLAPCRSASDCSEVTEIFSESYPLPPGQSVAGELRMGAQGVYEEVLPEAPSGGPGLTSHVGGRFYDNQGNQVWVVSPAFFLEGQLLDLAVTDSRVITRGGTYNNLAKRVGFTVRNRGSVPYTGPLPFFPINRPTLNLNCPTAPQTVAPGASFEATCELGYPFQLAHPPAGAFAGQTLEVALQVDDRFDSNNRHEGSWHLSNVSAEIFDVALRNVHVQGNHGPHPKIFFKVKNRSHSQGNPGGAFNQPPVGASGVSVSAYLEGSGELIWGPTPVSGGYLDPDEVIEMAITHGSLPIGEHRVRIEVTADGDHDAGNNKKFQDYEKTP